MVHLLSELPCPDELAAAVDFDALSPPEAEALSRQLLALPPAQRRSAFWSDVAAELLRRRSGSHVAPPRCRRSLVASTPHAALGLICCDCLSEGVPAYDDTLQRAVLSWYLPLVMQSPYLRAGNLTNSLIIYPLQLCKW